MAQLTPYADPERTPAGSLGQRSDDLGQAGIHAPLSFDAAAEVPRDGDAYRAPREGLLRDLRAAFLLALACAALIAAAWTAWTPALDGIAEAAATLAEREGDGRTQESVTIALGSLAVLPFVAAWWRRTHPRRPVRLSEGRGRMAVDAIAGQLRAAILAMDEVREAEVVVENRGRGRLRMRAWLRVAADARIDDALDGVDAAADWLVHNRLGLLLPEPPLVDVRYDELDLRASRARHQQDGTRDDGDA